MNAGRKYSRNTDSTRAFATLAISLAKGAAAAEDSAKSKTVSPEVTPATQATSATHTQFNANAAHLRAMRFFFLAAGSALAL